MKTSKKATLPRVFRAKWLAALRSGKFRQTTGSLVYPDSSKHVGYCCIGVACRISGLSNKVLHGNGTVDALVGIEKIIKRDSMLARAFPGTISVQGKFTKNLIYMNDKQGCNFKQIADYIEENTRAT